MVIGSRPGALSGLVLESVSRAVLDAATCPVLVVPRGERVPADEPDNPVAVDLTAGDTRSAEVPQ
jgi:hypothetical protein